MDLVTIWFALVVLCWVLFFVLDSWSAALKVTGAVYLIWLAWTTLRHGSALKIEDAPAGHRAPSSRSGRRTPSRSTRRTSSSSSRGR